MCRRGNISLHTEGGEKMNKLRGRIVEMGLTNKSLAEKIGLTEVGMSKRLNGRIQFTLKEICAIVDVLDIPKYEVADYFNIGEE